MAMASGRRLPLLLGAALALLTLAAYLPTLHNGFVNLDDGLYVTGNPHVQQGITGAGVAWALTANVANNWHPLTLLSHLLDCQLFGLDAAGHHATSLLLHLANVVLLFAVLRRLTGAVWRSAAVAALFAVHPAHVESVAWVAERKDVLSALFWLLAMAAYGRYARRPSVGRYLPVALAMALGLAAKPMVVTLPFALLLLDIWPLERLGLGWKRLAVEKLPLLALSAASSLVTLHYQRTSLAPLGLDPWSLRLANAAVSYTAYLGKLLLPSNLAVFYPIPLAIPAWKVAGAVALLAILTALAVRTARKAPWLLVGWLWFLGTLVPVIGLVQVGRQAMADRYTYIPSIGLFVAIVWGIAGLVGERRAVLATAAAVVIALLVAGTWMQAGTWRDSVTLYRHALAVTPDNYLAHLGLAKALVAKGDGAGAAEQYRAALALRPGLIEARAGLEAVLHAEDPHHPGPLLPTREKREKDVRRMGGSPLPGRVRGQG
jgi:tetratricopeptide (TPR) repeat protein